MTTAYASMAYVQTDVYPLDQLPQDTRDRIAYAVAQPKPPEKWLRLVGAEIPSRAWWEWHWQRGIHPGINTGRPHIPDALRQAVYDRDGYACLHCGATEQLSLDHIHPYSLGGPDTFANLQTLCRPCNSRKGARVNGTHSHDQA